MKKRKPQKMAGEKSEEFTLEADSELRFEIETKNKKVTVEVSVVRLCLLHKYQIAFAQITILFYFSVENGLR